MLRVQDAGTHRTAQSRVLVLDAVLTQQTGVVPLPAGSCSTLDAYSAVLRSKGGLLTNMTLKTIQTQWSTNEVVLRYKFGTWVMEWKTSMKPVQAHSKCAYI